VVVMDLEENLTSLRTTKKILMVNSASSSYLGQKQKGTLKHRNRQEARFKVPLPHP